MTGQEYADVMNCEVIAMALACLSGVTSSDVIDEGDLLMLQGVLRKWRDGFDARIKIDDNGDGGLDEQRDPHRRN